MLSQNQATDAIFLVFSTLLMLYVNIINSSLGHEHEALRSLSIWVVHKLSQSPDAARMTRSPLAVPEQHGRGPAGTFPVGESGSFL